jgi:hypothetical protein
MKASGSGIGQFWMMSETVLTGSAEPPKMHVVCLHLGTMQTLDLKQPSSQSS